MVSGVSRRFSKEEERERLKKIGGELLTGQEGMIIRTVSEGLSKEDIRQELQYLRAFWRELCQRIENGKPPSLIHQDSGLFERIVRDFAHESIGEIWIDHLLTLTNALLLCLQLLPLIEVSFYSLLSERFHLMKNKQKQ